MEKYQNGLVGAGIGALIGFGAQFLTNIWDTPCTGWVFWAMIIIPAITGAGTRCDEERWVPAVLWKIFYVLLTCIALLAVHFIVGLIIYAFTAIGWFGVAMVLFLIALIGAPVGGIIIFIIDR